MFDRTQGGPERFRRRILDRREDYLWPVDEEKLLALYDRMIDGTKVAEAAA